MHEISKKPKKEPLSRPWLAASLIQAPLMLSENVWSECYHCGEDIFQDEIWIQIAKFNKVGSDPTSIDFHLNCFQKIAGKKFIP